MQKPKHFRERRTIKAGTGKAELEILDESEEFSEMLECFQRNSKGSACPNTAKGIFVNFQEARDIFRLP